MNMIMTKKETGNPALEPLLQQMAEGSTEALAAFYEATRTAVYAFALSLAGEGHTAEDVMQETYLRAWQSAGSYLPMGKPMAWLLTITKNLVRMKYRADEGRQEPLDDTMAVPGFESASVDRLTLQAALACLGEEERQIVTLHAIAGLRHRETADLLGMPLSTVLSKYHRALSKLKKILKEEESR